MKKKLMITALVCAALAPLDARPQIATSANFTLEKSVVAGGGATSTGTTFSVTGTAGQAAAGEITGATLRMQSGFWSANNLAPTAAGVSLSGRVSVADGRGLRGAVVYLTEASGATRMTRTGSFGFYRFDDLAAGQIVTIAVSAKLYQFEPKVLSLNESLADVDFTPLEKAEARSGKEAETAPESPNSPPLIK